MVLILTTLSIRVITLTTLEAVSKPGFRNWVPKIGSCKIFGRPNFQGGSQYTHISTINMYKFIKIRHDIIKQCHFELYGDKKIQL